MLLEAQTVYDLIDQLRGEPIGSITVSIPIDVAERIMPSFFLNLWIDTPK